MFVRLTVRWLAPALLAAASLALAAPAAAQIDPCPAPVKQPPADSKPLLRCVQLVAHPVNETVVDQQTYAYYIKNQGSISKDDKWVVYNEDDIRADFWSLWKTGFLDNLWVEVIDEPYADGVMGEHVIYHIEERSRVKVVDYSAAKNGKLRIEVSKIEDSLRTRASSSISTRSSTRRRFARCRASSTISTPKKATTASRSCRPCTTVEGGPKLVRLTFTIDEGPKYIIKEVVFDGNEAFTDSKLASQMKDNKPRGWLSFITEAGKYQEAKFADDAQKVSDFYRENGYAKARVGNPQVETIDTSKDGKTRDIRLRIPVDEDRRYKVGKFEIADAKALKSDGLRALFKIKEGDYFNAKNLQKGMEKAKEAYGSFGYMEFTPEPDLCFAGTDCATGQPVGPQPAPAVVDITMRMDEGKQYFVNRITFTGNTTTHDNVIRRELRIADGGLFNTEALKESIRRLNQLGYFKPLEKTDDIVVQPTPGQDGHVDVKLKFTEQNRNQLSFGAGVSQFDGFFGQLSFQTANFLGRGETVGISLQKGSQARNYQVSFSEPYLFDRPITTGVDLYTREYIFPAQYTQDERGGNTTLGLPVRGYTRFFLSYGYTRVHVFNIDPAYLSPAVLASSPYLRDSLLIDSGGERTVSKITPSLVYNTVNAPIFPNAGTRYTVGAIVRGPRWRHAVLVDAARGHLVQALQQSHVDRFARAGRSTSGRSATRRCCRSSRSTSSGGEYSVRGFDIRTIGPRDPASNLVIGGNKSLNFNIEYYYQHRGARPSRRLLGRRTGAGRRQSVRLEGADRRPRAADRADPVRSARACAGAGEHDADSDDHDR